jgi:methanogenic corrinoid protein MtbC1
MNQPLNIDTIIERLLQLCVSGDRVGVRELHSQLEVAGLSASEIAQRLYWPSMQVIFRMWRQDQLTALAYRYATRILRMLVDQAQARYCQSQRNGRRLLCVCGPEESEDTAGQLCADLLEASGYEVLFAAGGVAHDEVMQEIAQRKPDAVIVFAASASDAPRIRHLIDNLREVHRDQSVPVICGAGVFARADGLADEIGATATAHDPADVIAAVHGAVFGTSAATQPRQRAKTPARSNRMPTAVRSAVA